MEKEEIKTDKKFYGKKSRYRINVTEERKDQVSVKRSQKKETSRQSIKIREEWKYQE